MTRSMTFAVLTAAALMGSTIMASAQTPAGGASAGTGAAASRAERIEDAQTNRQPGVTTGSTIREERDERRAAPNYPSNAPIPNAAISQPDATEAAPAGR